MESTLILAITLLAPVLILLAYQIRKNYLTKNPNSPPEVNELPVIDGVTVGSRVYEDRDETLYISVLSVNFGIVSYTIDDSRIVYEMPTSDFLDMYKPFRKRKALDHV